MKAYNTYLEVAQQAAEAEQQKQYSKALSLWQIAKLKANRIENMIWAECRMAFCEVWQHR